MPLNTHTLHYKCYAVQSGQLSGGSTLYILIREDTNISLHDLVKSFGNHFGQTCFCLPGATAINPGRTMVKRNEPCFPDTLFAYVNIKSPCAGITKPGSVSRE